MKVICDRGALVEALNLAGAIVVSRTPKPVLTCVKLVAADGQLSLSTTDLEVSMHMTIDQVEVSEPGEALIPADKLSQIVRESADSTLTIETEQNSARITGADSQFKIFGHDPKDFPAVPAFDGEANFEINAAELTDLIRKTLFATARENSRYAINGVLVEREGKKLTLVATDGRRLALAKGAVSNPNGEGSSAIIPTKALSQLTKLFNSPDETVRVKVTENQAIFATDTATLSTNLVEGNFPPYKDVVPKDQDKKAVFATDALASGVRRAALLTNEESKAVRFSFAPEQLTLTSRAPEMGEAEISVPIESYSGDAVDIGFNPHFVTEVLKVVDSDQVTMEFKAANKPGLIKTGPDFLYVVMPVSLS